MSKHDFLLKKAEVFERVALYGDRKSFLRALAQIQFPIGFPTQPMVDAMKPVEAKLSNMGRRIDDENKTNNAVSGELNTLYTALSNAMAVSYVNSEEELKTRAQGLMNTLSKITEKANEAAALQGLSPETSAYLKQMGGEATTASAAIGRDNSVRQVMPQQAPETPVATNTTTPQNQQAPAAKQQQNYQGPLASAQYMAQQSMATVGRLFDSKGPQASQRKYQVQKGLKPQVQMMIRMFKQSKDNQTKKVLYDALNNVYRGIEYDDLMELRDEFNFGRNFNEWQKELQNNDNPYQ